MTRQRYDGFGRPVLAQVLERDAQLNTTIQWSQSFHYDVHSGSSWQPSSALLGRLSRVSVDGVGDAYYAYDAFGRTASETQYLTAYGQMVRTSWAYSPGGALGEIRLQSPAGLDKIRYGYDSAGRTRTVSNPDTGLVYFDAQIVDPRGRYERVRLGNGVLETYEYALDGREELTRWSVQTGSGPRVHDYLKHDAEGRVVTERMAWGSTPYDFAHEYDVLDRLKRTKTVQGTSSWHETLTYDALGNILDRINSAASTHSRTFKYDTTDPDRLCRYDLTGQSGSGCPFTYDGAGNLTYDNWSGSRSFTYDASSRITEITKGSTRATFLYGPGGGLARMEIWNGTNLDRRIWSFGLIEQRTRPGGATTIERRVPGPLGPIATLRSQGTTNETIYVHGDGRANKFFTNSAGTVPQQVRYFAFGGILSDSASPSSLAYTDDLWNGGDDLRPLGVVRLGARIYDPNIGRFLQRDPLLIIPGSSKGNAYAFSFNDPVNYADPTGLNPQCDGLCPPLDLAIGVGLAVASGTLPWPTPGGLSWDPAKPATGVGSGSGLGIAPPAHTVGLPPSGRVAGVDPTGISVGIMQFHCGTLCSVGDFLEEEVASRAIGAGKVVGGGLGFVAGGALCETGVGCAIGGPLMLASADVAASGLGQTITGDHQRTVVGQYLGDTAQSIEEAVVGGAGLAHWVMGMGVNGSLKTS